MLVRRRQHDDMRKADLPIYEVADELVAAFPAYGRFIIEAPTGSGKSTQVPQILLDSGIVPEGLILVVEPRRLAARMLAQRVAHERGTRLGDEVGYQIRFHDRSSSRTRIKFVTEGILLRQMLAVPELRGVKTLIFDEFHERHAYSDVALARARNIQHAARPDLKIMVMSATLETQSLRRYLEPCLVLSCRGRAYPVTIEYIEKAWDPKSLPLWELTAREFERLLASHANGDVLVFMPGAYEINRTVERLRAGAAARRMAILPLHGELPERDQDLAVAPAPHRKVVVATNVAETSITIDGVCLVIDSGLARVARFDPMRGINTLLIEKIARASADQRTGRAGRTAPGHCLRLWTQQDHQTRPPSLAPEVQRIDLCEILLMLKAAPPSLCSDPARFPWLDPPNQPAVEAALRVLTDLGAIDAATGAITALGRRLAVFPMHPRFARMLLAAANSGYVREAALIAALTQERNILVRHCSALVRELRERKIETEQESDFFLMMRAWEYARDHDFDPGECQRVGIHAATAQRVQQTCDYFLDIARQAQILEGAEEPDSTQGNLQSKQTRQAAMSAAIRKCLLAAFSDQLARQTSMGANRYLLIHKRTGLIDRHSVVRGAPLVVATEIRQVQTAKGQLEVVMSLCSAIEQQWLEELFPRDFSTSRVVEYDPAGKRVVAQEVRSFRDLPLETSPTAVDKDQAARLLANEVLRHRLTLKMWDHSVEQWVLRINMLARACPELQFPAIGEEERRRLIEEICRAATSYKEIKERPVWPVVKRWLSPSQHAALAEHAPERLLLPNGRSAAIHYQPDGPPRIALRIQELYGVNEPLTVAKGCVPVLVQVLAPNQRPVQITPDLRGFWKNDYHKIKRGLQRKYPRHEWR